MSVNKVISDRLTPNLKNAITCLENALRHVNKAKIEYEDRNLDLEFALAMDCVKDCMEHISYLVKTRE